MQTKKTIILTGGGTAGHVLPNLALVSELKNHFERIVYIGSENGIERDLVTKNNIEYKSIPTVKLVRSFTLQNLLLPYRLIKAILNAKKILNEIKPNIIFSKGGYVSVPICLASTKTPIIMHESDLSMGLANKLIYPRCKVLCTNFKDTSIRYKKAHYTSTPLRDFKLKSNLCKFHLPKPTTLLIMGGSLGAKILNNIAYKIANQLCEKMNVIHLVGKNNLPNKELPSNYNIMEYCDNMNEVFARTDYVLSRAGATAITEFLYLRLPMLLIPLEKGSRGDQVQNSQNFVHKGYALELREDILTPDTLLKNINTLIQSASKLKTNMSHEKMPDAKKEIINLILKYVN